MYIKELKLKSYGKFQHKQVNFKDGFNIVYGNNETGKSTIHSFIESMLYGFKGSKLEDDINLYKKYRPRSNDQYYGSMELVEDIEDNCNYIIRKDFINKDTSFIKRNLNNNIEENIQTDEVGEYLFGIDKETFSNTLSVKQLSNATNEELAAEVKQKILNLSQTKDETISIDNIIKRLENVKEEVGDFNNTKSLISQYHQRVENLKAQREIALSKKSNTLQLGMEKMHRVKLINQLDEDIKDINIQLECYNIELLRVKKDKIDGYIYQINEIEKELLEYGEGNDIGLEDYEEALKLTTVLEKMRKERDVLESEILNLNSKIYKIKESMCNLEDVESIYQIVSDNYKSYDNVCENIKKLEEKILQGENLISSYDMSDINNFEKIYEQVNENEQRINRINCLKNEVSLELLESILSKYKSKKIINIIIGLLIFTMGCVSALIGYINNELIYYYGFGISIFSIIPFIIAGKSSKKIEEIVIEKINVKSKYDNLEDELSKRVSYNNDVLKQKDCINVEELNKKYNHNLSVKTIVGEKNKLLEYDKRNLKLLYNDKNKFEKILNINLLKLNLKDINQDSINKIKLMLDEKDKKEQELNTCSVMLKSIDENHKKLIKDLDYEQSRFNYILSTNNIETIDQFKTIVRNNYKIKPLKQKIEGLNEVINSVLEDYTYEQIVEKIQNYKHVNYNKQISVCNFNKEDKLKQIQLKKERKKVVKNEIEKIDNQIINIESNNEKLVVIEEEIDFYEEKIKNCMEKIKITDIAIDNIVLISNYIKGDFLPLLKNAISENFSYVTSNNYKEVLIDEEMNIAVVDKNGEKIENLNSLSGGTLDQLYVSLRLGLSGLISNNRKIPLILDDSFIQYDKERLERSLEVLNKESKRRQVILFTCQKREVSIVNEFGIECNKIMLYK